MWAICVPKCRPARLWRAVTVCIFMNFARLVRLLPRICEIQLGNDLPRREDLLISKGVVPISLVIFISQILGVVCDASFETVRAWRFHAH